MNETPQIFSYTTSNTLYNPSTFTIDNLNLTTTQMAQQGFYPVFPDANTIVPAAKPAKKEPPMATPKRRIVQVFIADTNENIPLEKSILYKGDQKLTDATDQELFFEIDIKAILEQYNAYRTTVRDKKVKEREEFLEPVKIRDLKMVVVTVAEF